MKHKAFRFLPIIFVVILIVSACKKENDSAQKVTADAEIATHYDDESIVSEEIDAIATDANSLLESEPVLSGDASVLEEAICDATVSANFETDPMTVTVTFNGTACGVRRTRTGVVVLSMAKGTEWKNAGSAINIEFQNLKITRKSDGKSITLNGSKTYTNVSGGLVYQAASLGTVIHSIHSSDLSVKFDDGTTRSWNIARKKIFSYDNGLVIGVHGLHEDGSITNITEWGTNRFGDAFTTSITTPVVIKQDCDFRVTGGAIKHQTEMFTAVATFGLNASGELSGCPGTGKYYYKLDWTRTSDGNSFNVLLPY